MAKSVEKPLTPVSPEDTTSSPKWVGEMGLQGGTRDLHFPRLAQLPPYVLAEVDELKAAAVARGEEVFDFGLGNPDLGAPDWVVDVLVQAVQNRENHRYAPSRGILPLRRAVASWYERRYQVALDPETEVVATIGSKEGLAHLFYATLGPGDQVLVPDPCYPIHRQGVIFAGGQVIDVPIVPGRDPLADYEKALHQARGSVRFAVMNFPHNPTTTTVTSEFWRRALAWAGKNDLYLISDLAYADLVFDGAQVCAPSALQAEGAKKRVVEFFTVSKSFHMPGWRVGFCVGNRELVGALRTIKSYLDYGIFAPLQHAAAAVLERGDALALETQATYCKRRNALCEGLNAAGWPVASPEATMFVWAPLPPSNAGMDSVALTKELFEATRVVVSPGTGFGRAGEGHVRFALVEEVPRIKQATERIARWLRTR